jgi:hypothetical protein
MDLVTCHCRNTRCVQCGKMGNASALQPHGSDRGEVRMRCTACGDVVSARACLQTRFWSVYFWDEQT